MSKKLEHNFSEIKNKKVLVTGGTGFIGSHLVESLLKENCEITVLDFDLFGSKLAIFQDVRYVNNSIKEINNIFGSEKFDFIFHFGEYSRVERSLEQPYKALQNTYSTLPHMLEFWHNSGAKLIYSGSSTKFNKIESDIRSSPYVAAKSLNVDLLKDYARWYSLPFAIVYFYNVYGGRERSDNSYGTVIAKYKRLVSEGKKVLPVTYPGTQRRNFTHIDDTISGIIMVAEKGFGDGYGIGSDTSYSILEVCSKFKCKPKFIEINLANRMEGVLNGKKVNSLGWRAKNSLDEYIDQFLREI